MLFALYIDDYLPSAMYYHVLQHLVNLYTSMFGLHIVTLPHGHLSL
jgi:hypothetical protein